jgi:exopolysaccharide biosynthesis protein
MKKLGCKDAMNLDGGASTYLNCNGKQIASPGRLLTNMLVFTKK